MARGWESKSVEAQQADRETPAEARPSIAPADAARLARRRTLELAKARAEADLLVATSPAYRAMLEAALRALNDQIYNG